MTYLASSDENHVRLISNNKNTLTVVETFRWNVSTICVIWFIGVVQLQIQTNPLTGLSVLSPFLAGTNSQLFA